MLSKQNCDIVIYNCSQSGQPAYLNRSTGGSRWGNAQPDKKGILIIESEFVREVTSPGALFPGMPTFYAEDFVETEKHSLESLHAWVQQQPYWHRSLLTDGCAIDSEVGTVALDSPPGAVSSLHAVTL